MGRPKGSSNKLTAKIKEQISNLIGGVINRIPLDEMSIDQKLKLLQLSLHYVLPKLRHSENEDTHRQDEPLFIEGVDRKEDSNEDKWSDNFEVKHTYKVDPNVGQKSA